MITFLWEFPSSGTKETMRRIEPETGWNPDSRLPAFSAIGRCEDPDCQPHGILPNDLARVIPPPPYYELTRVFGHVPDISSVLPWVVRFQRAPKGPNSIHFNGNVHSGFGSFHSSRHLRSRAIRTPSIVNC